MANWDKNCDKWRADWLNTQIESFLLSRLFRVGNNDGYTRKVSLDSILSLRFSNYRHFSIVQSLSNQMKCKILRDEENDFAEITRRKPNFLSPFFVHSLQTVTKIPQCLWFNVHSPISCSQINPRTLITTMENWSSSRTVRFSPFHCTAVTVRR